MSSTESGTVITGIGVVSPAGVGIEPLFDSLMDGHRWLEALDHPWAAPPYQLGAPVGDFGARRWIPVRKLRRINRLSQMAVVAAHDGLEHAQLTPEPGFGVVIGTGLGALRETMDFTAQLRQGDPRLAAPSLFPTTVMNVAAAHLSMALGIQGYNVTVNHKETSAEQAIMTADNALALGRADVVLVGGVDELTMPAHHAYRRFGALSRGAPSPYGADRDGVALGEGACVLVFERLEHARDRGAPILAHLAGACATGGRRHMIGWAPSPGDDVAEDAAICDRAVRRAMRAAALEPEAIDLVQGSGCGSEGHDRLEAGVLARVFGRRPVPLTSPHGAIGSWMASGALRAALGIEAMRRGEVFPTQLEGDVDPTLELRGLVRAPARDDIAAMLACSFASGGGNTALVLRGGPAWR